MAKEFEYLMKISESLEAGKWIAIVDAKVIATGDNGKEVFDEAKKACPQREPLIVRVPDSSVMLF